MQLSIRSEKSEDFKNIFENSLCVRGMMVIWKFIILFLCVFMSEIFCHTFFFNLGGDAHSR
jgi:hypothetical protein